MPHVKIMSSGINDIPLIARIHRSAFESNDEAELTLNLIEDNTAQPLISLSAYDGNIAVGHILFTKVWFKSRKNNPLMLLLAPLAIIPEYQRKGIGGLLIKRGLEMAGEIRTELAFVLGHINYYSKYGFINDAAKFGLNAPYPILKEVADAWMVKEIKKGALSKYEGNVACAVSLDKEEYWREQTI